MSTYPTLRTCAEMREQLKSVGYREIRHKLKERPISSMGTDDRKAVFLYSGNRFRCASLLRD